MALAVPTHRREQEKGLGFICGHWFFENSASHVNSTGQIIGFTGTQLFLFVDDGVTGLRLIDDLLVVNTDPDSLAAWLSLNAGDLWIYGFSDPDASGFGWICGYANFDSPVGFVLRPIATP